MWRVVTSTFAALTLFSTVAALNSRVRPTRPASSRKSTGTRSSGALIEARRAGCGRFGTLFVDGVTASLHRTAWAMLFAQQCPPLEGILPP